MPSKVPVHVAVNQAVTVFVRQIDSIKDGLPVAMTAIQKSHKDAHKAFDDFVRLECKKVEREGRTILLVPASLGSRHKTLRRELSKSFSAYDIVARSFLVALISQYDAFLGRLIRTLIAEVPLMLSGADENTEGRAEKSLSYSELFKFSSIEDAKEHVLSEAIESLLRKSHKEQVIWLENRFSLPLRKDLHIWPKFVEITQRRNLFVHCDGIVSKQYLAKCKEDQVKFSSEPKVGDELELDREYFEEAHAVIYEMGIKLSQVLRRKVMPKDLAAADLQLNEIAYELICAEEFQLAIKILDFGCEILKKHSDDKAAKMLVVNRANAYKLSGDKVAAGRVMESHDWTATGDAFKLAAAAIRDDVDEVIKMMRKLGSQSEDVNNVSYREWPLFVGMRDDPKFKAAFQKIFKEPLTPQNIETEETSEKSHKDDVDGSSGHPPSDPKVQRTKTKKATVH